MLILTLRTDKPQAEIGLFDSKTKLAYETWQAHRQLADTLHRKIEELLQSQAKSWQDIQGIVVFKGPGSFTGLRIGLTVAITLAYALDVPAVGQMGETWIAEGVKRLMQGEKDTLISPEYGAPVHITPQKR